MPLFHHFIAVIRAIRRNIQPECRSLFCPFPLLHVHYHSGLAGFGSNGSGPEQGRVPHSLQPNGARTLGHLHRGTDSPDCPTLADNDDKPPLLGTISHPDAMQVCAESSCAVDPPFHRAFQRAAFQAVLVAHRERRSKARNACRAQSPSLHRRGPCTTTHKPASKEKALRAMRLAVLHFSSLPCSAPFFHSSLLVITIFAQIADGRNSTLHTTDGILDATTLRPTADKTTTRNDAADDSLPSTIPLHPPRPLPH